MVVAVYLLDFASRISYSLIFFLTSLATSPKLFCCILLIRLISQGASELCQCTSLSASLSWWADPALIFKSHPQWTLWCTTRCTFKEGLVPHLLRLLSVDRLHLSVLSGIASAGRTSSPEVTSFWGWSTFDNWLRQEYQGLTLSASHRTTLSGHFSSRASHVVISGCQACIIAHLPPAFQRCWFQWHSLFNILNTEVCLRICFPQNPNVMLFICW